MTEPPRKTIVLALTGASGTPYGLDLLRKLHESPAVGNLFVVISGPGRQVLLEETGVRLDSPADLAAAGFPRATWLEEMNIAAPVASGSYPVDAMIIAPCTMGTLGAIATGAGRNLIHRAADVALKERRPLVLVPRETPLHAIHLENMLRLARAGAVILPAMPAFYHHPASIQDLVEHLSWRILSVLGLPTPPDRGWKGRP
jgi:4-hydroxy-3-polyprenylbenzoate decarboxylase